MNVEAASAARIAVVGAGLAGLRAAWRLARAGLEVVVYEARETVGGRAAGEWRAGHWMDSAWPVLDSGHGLLLRWIAEAGLADEMLPLRPVQMHAWHAERAHAIEPTSLRGAAWIPGWPILQTLKLLRWPRLMARYAPLLDARAPERAAPLDFRSVRDHVELYFGRAALDRWITPELQATFGDSVEDLSRVALLQFAKTRGLGAARVGLAGLPRRPLFELASAVAERLLVHRGACVQRIDEEASGGFRVEAIDARGLRSAADYDAVVVATSAREAVRIGASLLTTAERDGLAAVRERPVVCLALAVEGDDGGVPREIRFVRGDASIVSAYVVEPGQMLGRAAEGSSQIVALLRDEASLRALQEPDDVVVAKVLRALGRARPDLGKRVQTARVARTVAPFFEVGSYRRLARFFAVQRDRRALGRRLYWAGDHLAGAGFEAPVLSGDRAAEDLLADIDSQSSARGA
jgi:protoporphyrinogen oxidase